MTSRQFRLYPEEKHWFSFNDYGAVLDVMHRLRPKTVLEFGPGSSTLALIEGGAERIDSCEDNPDWFDVYHERLEKRFPTVVKLRRYAWADPLKVGRLAARYDMALIDGPHGTPKRPAVIKFCLNRCDAVLVPTEDHNNPNGRLRPVLFDLARECGRPIQIMETGALSGGFGLIQ